MQKRVTFFLQFKQRNSFLKEKFLTIQEKDIQTLDRYRLGFSYALVVFLCKIKNEYNTLRKQIHANSGNCLLSAERFV